MDSQKQTSDLGRIRAKSFNILRADVEALLDTIKQKYNYFLSVL